MDLAFGCLRIVLKWEGFDLESFQNDTSIYTHTLARVHTYIERDVCHSEEFEAEFFPLNYNPTTSECKIHSVEVDMHYFK